MNKRIKQNLTIDKTNRLFIQLPTGQLIFACNANLMNRIQFQLIAEGITKELLPVEELEDLWAIDT